MNRDGKAANKYTYYYTQSYRQKVGIGSLLDIIAEKNGVIAIVEVKQRGENAMYAPREAVNFAKQKKIKRTAQYYMLKNGLCEKAIFCKKLFFCNLRT